MQNPTLVDINSKSTKLFHKIVHASVHNSKNTRDFPVLTSYQTFKQTLQ